MTKLNKTHLELSKIARNLLVKKNQSVTDNFLLVSKFDLKLWGLSPQTPDAFGNDLANEVAIKAAVK